MRRTTAQREVCGCRKVLNNELRGHKVRSVPAASRRVDGEGTTKHLQPLPSSNIKEGEQRSAVRRDAEGSGHLIHM